MVYEPDLKILKVALSVSPKKKMRAKNYYICVFAWNYCFIGMSVPAYRQVQGSPSFYLFLFMAFLSGQYEK